eukprot:798559-Amorphochlora_amoeboformis.AAC.1
MISRPLSRITTGAQSGIHSWVGGGRWGRKRRRKWVLPDMVMGIEWETEKGREMGRELDTET